MTLLPVERPHEDCRVADSGAISTRYWTCKKINYLARLIGPAD